MIYVNLDPAYFTHIKTIRLIALLGPNMDVLPLRLWAHCGMHHAETGTLSGYTMQEIEQIVGWTGKPGKAVAAMVKVGFLDNLESEYRVHDWLEHEGHISALKKRSQKANEARWGRMRETDSPSRKREATGFLTTDSGSRSPGVEAEDPAVERDGPEFEKGSFGAGTGSRGFDEGTPEVETTIPRVETGSPKVQTWTPKIETGTPLSLPSVPFHPEKKKQQQQLLQDLPPENLKTGTRKAKDPPRTAVLLEAPATADTVTTHTPPVPATPGNDLEQIIYDRVGWRKRLSRADIDKVLELKRKHGEEFYSACERLHTGVDIVPAYLRAILEPKDKAAEQAERFKELVEKSGIRWAN